MSSRNPNGESQKPSFWNTLPGLITAIAALLSAGGGLYTLYRSQNVPPTQEVVAPQPKVVPSPVNPQPGLPPDQNPDARPAKPTTENPLREGNYELQQRYGASGKSAVIMRLSQVTDEHFVVVTTTHTRDFWSGQLIRKGDDWDVVIEKQQGGPKGPMAIKIKSGNPGNGLHQVTRQGRLLTFKGGNGTFVWKMVEHPADK
jgi:hypothetical protein